MRKGFARYMAGILAAQMVLSSGGPFVYGAQMENPVSVESQDQSGDGLEEDHMNGTETETPGEPEASESENPEGQEVPGTFRSGRASCAGNSGECSSG